jgi:hypothetical protein
MANRFLNTSFFKSPFVRGLEGSLKTLYCFIICDCEPSGIWSKDLDIAGVYTGFKFTESQFYKSFVETGKAVDLGNGKYFFPDFIEHQYPKGLSEKNIAHNNIIPILLSLNLLDENLKPLKRPFEGSKVMVMDKVKEKVLVIPDKFDFKNALLSYGFDKTLISEWLEVRRKKKAVNTETAYKGFITEVEKTNLDKNKVLQMCVEKSWQGFTASWITEKKSITPPNMERMKNDDRFL